MFHRIQFQQAWGVRHRLHQKDADGYTQSFSPCLKINTIVWKTGLIEKRVCRSKFRLVQYQKMRMRGRPDLWRTSSLSFHKMHLCFQNLAAKLHQWPISSRLKYPHARLHSLQKLSVVLEHDTLQRWTIVDSCLSRDGMSWNRDEQMYSWMVILNQIQNTWKINKLLRSKAVRYRYRRCSFASSLLQGKHELKISSLIVLLLVKEIAHALPHVRRVFSLVLDAELSTAVDFEGPDPSCHL